MICHCFWGSIVIVLSNICLSSVSYPFTIFLGGGFISRDRRVSHDSATHHTHVTVSRVETEHISFGDYHGGANCYNLSNIYFVLTQLICCLCYNLIRGYSNFNAVEIPISQLSWTPTLCTFECKEIDDQCLSNSFFLRSNTLIRECCKSHSVFFWNVLVKNRHLNVKQKRGGLSWSFIWQWLSPNTPLHVQGTAFHLSFSRRRRP